MLSTEAKRRSVNIALVYQSEALNSHVREAMTELGAKVVYESSVLAYRSKELAGSGAEVVIINLDPSSDDNLGGIDDLLIDDSRRVVFNDGEVTARLSGWDLARWARHLAAKVLGEQVGLPPPPAGAEAIPQAGMQRADLSTPDRPKTLEPTTPIGSVAEAEFAADEMTRALAGFSMEQASFSEQKAAQDDLSSTLAGLGLGDFDFSDPKPAAPAAKISESKSIFEELGLGLDMPASSAPSPAASIAPTPEKEDDNPFAGLDINFDRFDDVEPAREEPQGLDALLANLPKETKPEKPVERNDRSNAPTLELPVPPALSAKKPSAEPSANPFAGLSLELSPLDGQAPDAPPPASSSPKGPSKPSLAERDFSAALASLSLAPLEDAPADTPAPTPAKAPAAAPAAPVAKDRGALDLGSLSLEPIEQEVDNIFTAAAKNRAASAESGSAAPPALPPDLPSGPPDLPDLDEDNPFADLDLNFDQLGQSEPVKVAKESFNDGPSEDDFLKEFGAFGALETPVGGALEHVVVLGASIGGPDAVREFLGAVQGNSRTVFVLAQHMGADFVELMAQQLQRATRMHVLMPSSGQIAKAGDVLIVPVTERLLLEPSGEVRLVTPDQASPYSPSIDQVLFDVADRFGDRAMAIIFSGMAHDAIEGAKYLAGKGGRVWVQDPSTCVVSSMIDGAVEAGIVSYIGSPADLAAQFNREFK